MTRLGDIARVVRSKNAGALLLTLDVIFDDEKSYARVLESGRISPEAVAARYGVAASDVDIIAYPVAFAIKITLPRTHPSGHPGDGDVYGAQQHVPLLDLQIP